MIKLFLKIYFTYLLFFTIAFLFATISPTDTLDTYLFIFTLAAISSLIFSSFTLIKYLKKIKKQKSKLKNKKHSIKDTSLNIDTGGSLDGAPSESILAILFYFFDFFSKKKKK